MSRASLIHADEATEDNSMADTMSPVYLTQWELIGQKY